MSARGGEAAGTMTLRLRIVSDHRRQLGERASISFGVDGGSIGRSADNDWVLPDPIRYVSAHHARVQHRDGHFYLQDVSTNGVFVNDSETALAKAHPAGHQLKSGDVIRMGDYHIVATLEEAATEAEPKTPEPQIAGGEVPTSIHALRTLGRSPAQTDIGAMLNLDDLLVPNSEVEVYHPVNAYGQAVSQVPAEALPRPAPAPRPPVTAAQVSEGEVMDRRVARLARAAAREPRSNAANAALYDVQTGLQAFCRGAGIDADKLPADAQTRMLHLAGQLFREALVGLKDLERSRSETRNRYRIELPADPEDPRPSLARSTVEELLVDLFLQHESRRLDAVGWLRDAISDGKTHEAGAARATRAAFIEFLDRLDPAELEARFERAARRGKRSADKAQYWEMFTTFYRNLIEMPADHLPHTFVEAFAAAYREHVRKAHQPS